MAVFEKIHNERKRISKWYTKYQKTGNGGRLGEWRKRVTKGSLS